MNFSVIFLHAKRILSISKNDFPLFAYSIENRKGIKQYHNGTVRPRYCCMVLDGQLVAVMGLEILPKAIFISPLEVHDDYRDMGIGSGLVKKLFSVNVENLICYSSDDVVGFWEKLGFEKHGMTEYDEHRMVRRQSCVN